MDLSRRVVARAVEAAARGIRSVPITSWKGVRAGFILSTGRTGTLRLAEILGQVTEGALVLHEPPPDLFDLGEGVARGAISTDMAVRELRRARQGMSARVRFRKLDGYVESNTNAAYLPNAIRSVFDAPRFVHVVRDGRAVVRSLYSKTNPSRRPGQDRAHFMDHDDVRCRLSAVDFPDDPWADPWPVLSRFQRICWHWAKKNSLIREALGAAPDALLVRFEDIFDEETGFAGFWEVVRFLGLEHRLARSRAEVQDMLAIRSNRTSGYLLPPPGEWSGELRESFNRIAGPEQSRYYT